MYPAFVVRSADRWPRWVTRIGLPALRRALLRDDVSEYPIQVLTILPSLPSAPCSVTGRRKLSGQRIGRCGDDRGLAINVARLQYGPGDAGILGGLRQNRDLDRAAGENAALPRAGAFGA
jgi:hypothetical protein